MGTFNPNCRCGKKKDESNTRLKNGKLYYICRNCEKEYIKESYAKMTDEQRERKRSNHRKNYAKNKEKFKQYRIENKKKIDDYNKEYYSLNSDKLLEKRKEYRDNNKSSMNEYNREYHKAHRHNPRTVILNRLRARLHRFGLTMNQFHNNFDVDEYLDIVIDKILSKMTMSDFIEKSYELDHTIPINKFKDKIYAFHHSNVNPLRPDDHAKKTRQEAS